MGEGAKKNRQKWVKELKNQVKVIVRAKWHDQSGEKPKRTRKKVKKQKAMVKVGEGAKEQCKSVRRNQRRR